MLAPPIFSWCVTFYCLGLVYLTNLTFYGKALNRSRYMCSGRDIKSVEAGPQRKAGNRDVFRSGSESGDAGAEAPPVWPLLAE